MIHHLRALAQFLESASYEDTVIIGGFNGTRSRSAIHVVRIKEVELGMVTVCDGSPHPTVDNCWCTAFGRVDRHAEMCVIVEYTRWLDGAITSFDALTSDP